MVYIHPYIHPKLVSHVALIWGLENPGSAESEHIYPSGMCSMVFHYGTPFRFDDLSIQKPFTLNGLSTRPSVVTAPQGACVIFVELFPHACSLLFSESMIQFQNKSVDINNITKNWQNRLQQFDDSEIYAKCQIVQDFLVAQLPDSMSYKIEKSMHIVKSISDVGGFKSLSWHLDKSGMSERSLERLFNEHVGVSPKKYIDIIKLQNVILLLQSKSSNIAYIAQDAGFSDESHFNKWIRRLTGFTPGYFTGQ